jgi:hypothetical protein
MLYSHISEGGLTDEQQLIDEQHYNDLKSLFDDGLCSLAWKTGLANILRKGNLYVYHDAGLDPYVDDYIALKILNAARGELDRELDIEEDLFNTARRGGRLHRSHKNTKKKRRKSKKRGKIKGRKTKRKRKKSKKIRR